MPTVRTILLYAPSEDGRALASRLAGAEALVTVAETPEQVRVVLDALSPLLFLCDLAAPEAEPLLSAAAAKNATLVVAASTLETRGIATQLVDSDSVTAFIPDLADIDSAADLLPVLETIGAEDSPSLVPSNTVPAWSGSAAFPDPFRKPPSPDPSRYQLLSKTGEGASGEVWRARDMLLDMDVAIKVLREDLSEDTESIQAMKAEARIAMELSHSNVVRLYNLLQFEGRTYLVMEYIEGETIESMLRRYGALDPDLVEGVVASCAEGLDYAHRHGVLHRDLKPANLFLTSENKLKIIDFGVAALLGPVTGAPDEIAGTPQYMSPEQLRGEPLTAASDLYSLGIVAYQMMTGRTPEIGSFDPKHPELFRRGPLVGVAPLVRTVLEGATDSEPERRFPSVHAFSRAFSKALHASRRATPRPQGEA